MLRPRIGPRVALHNRTGLNTPSGPAVPPGPGWPPPGHNGGPLLKPDDPNESWRRYCWKRAHKAAWKTPPREIALRRLERAEAAGMTYREYTLEILERGRHL